MGSAFGCPTDVTVAGSCAVSSSQGADGVKIVCEHEHETGVVTGPCYDRCDGPDRGRGVENLQHTAGVGAACAMYRSAPALAVVRSSSRTVWTPGGEVRRELRMVGRLGAHARTPPVCGGQVLRAAAECGSAGTAAT